eukprot:CAMPEP_0113889296 /NCGR_PEP_ID=MMETSP0780_2-20120614/13404_1 /TAXON_ID=652834 /ORGANISM="Palpitomonas bilix" /LENGTH=370 /DNA_ID=CAMNT_0000878351 /DNA_START=122 /DNA_END=1234 /DNA_ORIENTATION=+ /assembly_acc=CAM_ASM_000599
MSHEQAFVLRLPDHLAAKLREQLATNDLSGSSAEQDGRKMRFNFDKLGAFEGDILELPTHVEIHKQFEKTERRTSHVFKTNDITQMVVVKDTHHAQKKKIARETSEEGVKEAVDGLTPPSRNIRKVYIESPLAPGKGELDTTQKQIGMDALMSLVNGQASALVGKLADEDETIYNVRMPDQEGEEEEEGEEEKEEEEGKTANGEMAGEGALATTVPTTGGEGGEGADITTAPASGGAVPDVSIVGDEIDVDGIGELEIDLGGVEVDDSTVKVKEEEMEVDLFDIGDVNLDALAEVEAKARVEQKQKDLTFIEAAIVDTRTRLLADIGKRDKSSLKQVKERYVKSIEKLEAELKELEEKEQQLREEIAKAQ